VLANELQRSPKRLNLEQAKIFIVHGRDELALAQLKNPSASKESSADRT
jgi:predicted nucleotide-binding protein